MKRWLVFGVVGLLSVSVSALSAAASDEVQYDSIELVQGLFFGHGPVAGLFPELHGSDQNRGNSWSAADRGAFVAHVEQSEDPDFLDDFAATIQGGDHVEIDDAMERAEHVIDGFSIDLDRDSEAMPPEAGISWFMAVNAVTAVNFSAAINITAYAQIHASVFLFEAMYVWTYGPPMASRLHDDYIVALVAERLTVA